MMLSSGWLVAEAARPRSLVMGEEKESVGVSVGKEKEEEMLGEEQRPVLDEDIVAAVNQHEGAGWKAGFNERLEGMSVRDFRTLCGARKSKGTASLLRSPSAASAAAAAAAGSELPAQFDSRQRWPQCSSISDILDQGHCGSCWAFGAVEALSDRMCIAFNDTQELSENDLLACCGFFCGDGCEGGYPLQAWTYFMTDGVVSTSCDPYFDRKGCHHPGCEPLFPTPTCERHCSQQDQSWDSSKRYVSDVYTVGPAVEEIMYEVYTNGPVEVSFSVFQDFAHYKSGVYWHVTGDYLGGHAVKLIGWGTEGGVDYWLCVNSWNRSWGDDGYFKIRRGTDECGIEEEVVAGTPSLVKVENPLPYRAAAATAAAAAAA
ncbi:hypothetical protein CBR_g2790 [Chara braunii]|uniref:Peptidase C1A papain C-terminal domain-containing protein n=1 Tax=Chara braunii TaxID=69332 RepID=A0A388KDW3_CHABU|nr:hypothetical protein CBR_g2790 [Chara braunii]|eukprot:GBG68239.1 hypothetical protein CBR_g2790 [Chara braunii]